MTKHNILEKIDELFGDGSPPDVSKLTTLVQESLHFFEDLRTKLESPKTEEKNEAIDMAKQLQQKLEGLADQSLAASGMTKEEVQELLRNPSNFNEKDWNTYQSVDKEIKEYQKEVLKSAPTSFEPTPSPEKKKLPKSGKKGWVRL